MSGQSEDVGILAEHLFRSSKKRKAFPRRRNEAIDQAQEAESIEHTKTDCSLLAPGSAVDTNERDDAIANNRFQRRRFSRRHGGVTFTVQQSSSQAPAQPLAPRLDAAPAQEAPTTIANRFASQTGQISAVTDKHMAAYIDTELARLNAHNVSIMSDSASLFPTGSISAPDNQAYQQRQLENSHKMIPQKQAATLGRLQEIDLGPDEQARNIALTEAATRRLHGDAGQTSQPKIDRVEKVRTGRDGRPIPSRRWKRRGSEDLARDSLVEAILSEARTEHVYEKELEEDDDEDIAADERLAEQFQAEFIEQMEAKNAQAAARAAKPPEATTGGKSGERDEYAKGPKLGGSRMQRAAMRERDVASKGGSVNRGGRF